MLPNELKLMTTTVMNSASLYFGIVIINII